MAQRDVAGLHAAAGCWRGFAASLGEAEQQLNAPRPVIAEQEIPEGGLIQPVLSEHNGFAGSPEVGDHIPQGLSLDRIGPNGGAFMSVEGAPLAERATPPGLASQYHTMLGSGIRVPDGWWYCMDPRRRHLGSLAARSNG